MSSTLDNLFEQILHSEQKAQEQRNVLNEVKAELSRTLAEIQDVKDETNALEGQLVLKVQQWNNEELRSKWLNAQVDILTEQKQDLKKQIEEATKKLNELRNKVVEVSSQFCKDVQNFAQNYDLVSVAQDHRQQFAKEAIISLQARIMLLESELIECRVKQETMLELKKEKESVTQKLSETTETIKGIEEIYTKLQEKTKELEQEKKLVEQIPHSGAEFKKLQAELEVCRDDTLEGMCAALQEELQQLQQQQWQQQLQQKRIVQQQYHSSRKQKLAAQKQQLHPPAEQDTPSDQNTESANETARNNFQRFTSFSKMKGCSSSTTLSQQKTVGNPSNPSSSKPQKPPNIGKLTSRIQNDKRLSNTWQSQTERRHDPSSEHSHQEAD